MPYIIPNTTATPQTVSAAQIIVNGTTCTWPSDKIVEGVKVIHHIECSIGCENTGAAPAELKFTLQLDIGEGWEDVTGEVACYTIAAGDDARRKANFKVPYYTGISGFVPRYRLLAECPAGEITLHRADGRDAVPTVTGKQEHEFQGEPPVVEEIAFALEVERLGSPVGTGAIWGENNSNRHFIGISGNRFVWAGRRDTYIAQTVVGSITDAGQVTFGALSEDSLNNVSLSSNTYGVCYIGNNKFARFRQQSTGYTKGFAAWDCGASGLSASLVTDNNNGVTTITPGGWRDSVLYSNSKIYAISNTYSPDYNRCLLQVCDISNVNGATSNRVDIDAVFGIGRTVYYVSGEQGKLQGKAAPGGAMWVVKTADASDEYSNSALEIVTSNGSSANRYSCADADGDPLGLVVADDGVFAFAYRTTDGKIRVRVGKLTGLVPSFGGAFDIYGGATGQQLYSADMDIIETGKFALAVQNYSLSNNHYIAFESDGVSVTCGDTYGTHAMLSYGNQPIMLAQSGYAGKLIVGNYGRTGSSYFPTNGSRYVSMISLMSDPAIINAGTPVSFTIDAGQEWERHYAIKATAAGNLTVDITGMPVGSDLDLYLRKSLRATNANYDAFSENSGNSDEQCVVAVAEDDVVYVRLRVYQNSSGTITATLS